MKQIKMKINIKSILNFLLIFITMTILYTQAIYATNNEILFEFKCNDQIKPNGIFDIDVQAYSVDNTSIGVFSANISYDPEIIEFKKVISNNTNVKVKYSLKSLGNLTIIYLNPDGTNLSNDATSLFFIEFKMLSSENTFISADIYDIYDIYTNTININKINNFYISVDDVNNNSNVNNSSSINNSNVDSMDKNDNIIKNIGENSETKSVTMFILGMFAITIIFVVCVISYNLGIRKSNKNTYQSFEYNSKSNDEKNKKDDN